MAPRSSVGWQVRGGIGTRDDDVAPERCHPGGHGGTGTHGSRPHSIRTDRPSPYTGHPLKRVGLLFRSVGHRAQPGARGTIRGRARRRGSAHTTSVIRRTFSGAHTTSVIRRTISGARTTSVIRRATRAMGTLCHAARTACRQPRPRTTFRRSTHSTSGVRRTARTAHATRTPRTTLTTHTTRTTSGVRRTAHATHAAPTN